MVIQSNGNRFNNDSVYLFKYIIFQMDPISLNEKKLHPIMDRVQSKTVSLFSKQILAIH